VAFAGERCAKQGKRGKKGIALEARVLLPGDEFAKITRKTDTLSPTVPLHSRKTDSTSGTQEKKL